MCGRFALAISPEILAAFFELDAVPGNSSISYNIAPGQKIGVVRLTRRGTRRWGQLRWGLVPHWAKARDGGAHMINARRESLADKPAFREAYRRRRCLIPASGFYEWKKGDGGRRQPHYVAAADGAPMALAGLWERWRDPSGPDQASAIDSCTIITTPAEGPLAAIHDRAPAVVPRASWSAWLDRDFYDQEALQAMLRHPDALSIVPVDTRVNDPGVDDEACIQPVAPSVV